VPPPPDPLATTPFLYLTTTGRVSGQPRDIEIWFVRDGQALYVLASNRERAQWVRNIVADGNVRVRLLGHETAATARVLDRSRDADEWRTAQQLSAEKYGWGDGLPVRISPEQWPW